MRWWKGSGALIDYTNPEAVEWWHRLMDRALSLGVDGWKMDGSAEMFALTKRQTSRQLIYRAIVERHIGKHTGLPHSAKAVLKDKLGDGYRRQGWCR